MLASSIFCENQIFHGYLCSQLMFIRKVLNPSLSIIFDLLYTGTGAPYLVDVVKEDGEHLIVGQVR